jgi:hypothetical protein
MKLMVKKRLKQMIRDLPKEQHGRKTDKQRVGEVTSYDVVDDVTSNVYGSEII